MSTVDQLYP
ncbi:hypothetical protein TIFTF001_023623, partial [Ficus carica]